MPSSNWDASRTNWQVVRDANQVVDLTLRPDGRYAAERGTGLVKVRWEALQTNAVAGGPFNFTIPASTNVQDRSCRLKFSEELVVEATPAE
jgi:hypothetical protein